MKKILAVSGGIDSVVMLHLLKDEAPIVAHFDHGIRPNSHEDAKFVEKLASEYGLEFEMKHANLGANCSEATARAARYDFLRDLAQKYDGRICVAHHADDVLESVAINILRGTGWRGLTPMYLSEIERPLLDWQKSDIYRYATEHNLSFRQDQTNTEGNYLRNRVREKLLFLPKEDKAKLLELFKSQCVLRDECEQLLSEIAEASQLKAVITSESDERVAMEILRHMLEKNGFSLTRPQLERCLDAIKTYAPGKRFSLGVNRFLEVGKYSFRVV